MTDRLSTLYQDLLGGSYDCVDRIVLNAYFRMGHDPGGSSPPENDGCKPPHTLQAHCAGWERFEELKRAHISASYAFFARRFSNTELDQVFERCLYPAGLQTGYELRTVPQRAGLIDAVIENEIRRVGSWLP